LMIKNYEGFFKKNLASFFIFGDLLQL